MDVLNIFLFIMFFNYYCAVLVLVGGTLYLIWLIIKDFKEFLISLIIIIIIIIRLCVKQLKKYLCYLIVESQLFNCSNLFCFYFFYHKT